MSDIIKYTISGKLSPASKYKNINEIKEKSQNVFRFSKPESQYELTLKLDMATEIQVIQIKTVQVDMFQISLFLNDKTISSYPKKLNKKEVEGKPFEMKISSDEADTLKIKLINIPDPRKSEIHHILVKGVERIKQEPQEKENKKGKGRGKGKKQIQIPEKPILKEEDKKIFEERKTKSDAKMLKQQLGLDMDVDQLAAMILKNKQQRVDREEDSEFKRQVEELERFHENNYHNSNYNYNVEEERDYLIQDYDIIPFSRDLEEMMRNVTEEWIEAQRKMQVSCGVSQQHRLSSKTPELYFRNIKFCFGNICKKSFDKDELAKKIKTLGGTIVQKPEHSCVILTEQMKGNKIKIAKDLQDIKYISPVYIEQCKVEKEKLPFQLYSIS